MDSELPYHYKHADLDSLCRKEFINNRRLYTWECVDNKIDFIIGGNYVNKSADQGIVIQGGLTSPSMIEFAIRRYLQCCPNSQIILSTWSDSPNEIIIKFSDWFKSNEKLHLVLSDKPNYFGGANTNLQIISTQAGIKHAEKHGCKFVLKHRTDMLFANLKFLDTLNILYQSFQENISNAQTGRIVVGSTGSFKTRPFSVSDLFSYGHINDMELMWDLELSQSEKDTREVRINPPSVEDKTPITGNDLKFLEWCISSSTNKIAESYICSKLLEKSNYSYSHDWTDSRLFLASCFLVCDANSLGLVWPKYGTTTSYYKYKSCHAWGESFAKSSYGMDEISFADWLSYFNELQERNNNQAE